MENSHLESTSIKAGAPTSAVDTAFQATPSAPTAAKPAVSPIWQTLQLLGSLRITVVLIVLAMLLVFYGTLAQKTSSIETAVNEYFRCKSIVWIKLQIILCMIDFDPKEPGYGWLDYRIPFPGGWLLGALMLINLLAAHIVRFHFGDLVKIFGWFLGKSPLPKNTPKVLGIWLIHLGIIVIMVHELIYGLAAVESQMRISVGESSNYVENFHRPEIAVSYVESAEYDRLITFTKHAVEESARENAYARKHNKELKRLTTEKLPFEIQVDLYYTNARIRKVTENGAVQAPFTPTMGWGVEYVLEDRGDFSGVAESENVAVPGAYVTLFKKSEKIGTLLLWSGLYSTTDSIVVDGKKYEISLRFEREDRPFTIRLLKAVRELHPNSTKPKSFRSEIQLINPETQEQRSVAIFMNNPLTYGGETFFQSQMNEVQGKMQSVFSVVRNPGARMPELGCLLVSCGMLIHFLAILIRFINRFQNQRGAIA